MILHSMHRRKKTKFFCTTAARGELKKSFFAPPSSPTPPPVNHALFCRVPLPLQGNINNIWLDPLHAWTALYEKTFYLVLPKCSMHSFPSALPSSVTLGWLYGFPIVKMPYTSPDEYWQAYQPEERNLRNARMTFSHNSL